MKSFIILSHITLLWLAMLPFNSYSQTKLDLFIWAGQSNAQGWMGDAAFYPEEEKELDDSILLNWTFVDNESSGGNWGKLQAQKGRFPKGHFGPEVSFGRELKKAGYHPAIFKYTKGATGLARDWKAPGQGGIYDSMVQDLKLAIHRLEDQGFEVTLGGLIWIQGETDAGSDTTAREYYANLKQMIQHIRDVVLDEPNLKIILGVDEQHSFVKEHPVVLAAQRRLAEEDPNIVFTSMLGLPKADATHLTPAGLVGHGKRIANAYVSMLPESLVEKQENGLPNILFILVDDLGNHDLGYAGSLFYETPHIDKLASECMKFTNAYASSPICSPARAAIMTGKHPARLNLTDYIPGNRHYGPHPDQKLASYPFNLFLDSAETTIAKALQSNGYATFFAGKWHLGEKEIHYPENHGFEINRGGNHIGHPAGGYFSPYNNPQLPDGIYKTA